MPTLTQFIVGRMQAAGFEPTDLGVVYFYDATIYSWREVPVHAAKPIFDSVDAGDVHANKRNRLQFVVTGADPDDERTFRWDDDAGTFVPVRGDDDFVFTAEHLTDP